MRHNTVGTLQPVQLIGIRIEAENKLLGWQDPDDFITEKDHLEVVDQADEDGYERGLKAGRKEAEDEAERNIEQREEAAFAEGRADALSDMDRAADVARVAELLAQLKKAHNALLLYQGVQEPGAYCKRPIKLSEAKTTMQRTALVLRLALNAYERPNGAE